MAIIKYRRSEHTKVKLIKAGNGLSYARWESLNRTCLKLNIRGIKFNWVKLVRNRWTTQMRVKPGPGTAATARRGRRRRRSPAVAGGARAARAARSLARPFYFPRCGRHPNAQCKKNKKTDRRIFISRQRDTSAPQTCHQRVRPAHDCEVYSRWR